MMLSHGFASNISFFPYEIVERKLSGKFGRTKLENSGTFNRGSKTKTRSSPNSPLHILSPTPGRLRPAGKAGLRAGSIMCDIEMLCTMVRTDPLFTKSPRVQVETVWATTAAARRPSHDFISLGRARPQ